MKKMALAVLAALTFLALETKGFSSTLPPVPICKHSAGANRQPCRVPTPLPPQSIKHAQTR